MLVLPAALTQDNARACLQMLVQSLRLNPASSVMVDASALQTFDSSALAVLLECRRESLAQGKSFAIQGLCPKLSALAQLYGIETLLPAAAATTTATPTPAATQPA